MVTDTLRVMSIGIWVQACIERCKLNKKINTIKQKLRNRMSTSNLESMMRVAIEGPNNDFDDILTSALDLWKDAAKFRHLYSIP